MNTLGSTPIAKRSGSLKPPIADNRFKTVADSYFGMRRSTRGPAEADKDILNSHYKFHKGTTYAIGNEKDVNNSVTNAQESFVPKLRQESYDL